MSQQPFSSDGGFSTSGNVISNNVSVTGNIIGDGNLLTNINGANITGNVANANTAGVAYTAYSIDGGNVSGNVANANTAGVAYTAYSIDGGNVSGNVANANTAGVAYTAYSIDGSNVSGQVSNALIAGTVYENAQSNITSVGTLSSVTSTGLISTTGNVVGNYIIGDGSLLTGLSASYGNANVADYLPTYTGNLRVDNINLNGNIVATPQFFSINWGTYHMDFSQYARVDIVDSALNVYGNITAESGNYFIGDGSQLTNLPVQTGTYSNSNVSSYLEVLTSNVSTTGSVNASNLTINGNAIITGNANIQGTLSYTNVNNLTTSNLVLGLGNNQTNVNVTGGGIVVGNTNEASFLYDFTAQSWTSNIAISAVGNVSGNYVIGNGSQLTSITGNNVTGNVANANSAGVAYTAYSIDGGNVTGNVANANSAGIAYTAYSIDGGNVTGNVANANSAGVAYTAYSIDGGNVTGNVANANSAGVAYTAYAVSGGNVTGNVANANSAGIAYTAYAVSGGNVSGQVGNALIAGTVYTNAQPNITSTGTLTSITSSGLISTTGNVSANYIIGNGSLLTNLPVQPGTYSNTNVASYVTVLTSDVSTTGNILAAGYLSATGNMISGNMSTAGNISGKNYFGNIQTTYVKPPTTYYLDGTNGNDTTGDGSILYPYKTFAKLLTLSNINSGCEIIVFPATYSENVVWNQTNINFVGPGYGGLVNLTGTWQFTHTTSSIRVNGFNFANTVTVSGAGNLYLFTSSVAGLTKSGSGYLELTDTETSNGSVSITGSGSVNMIGGKSSTVTLNNAAAILTLDNHSAGLAVYTITAGSFVANDSTMLGATTTSNVITTAAGTSSIINNTGFAQSNGTAGRVSIAGFWSFTAVNYDKTNSVIAGTNIGGSTYSDSYYSFGLISAVGNITGANIRTAGTVSATGNVIGSYIISNGSQLTSITGNNVTGTVANATFAVSAGSATTANTAATVTTNAQPNITSVGTLTSITSTGLISTTGNVSANYIIGNGSLLTGLPASYANANVASYLTVLTSDISTTGNITANYIIGNGSQLSGLPASYANANAVAYGQAGWAGNIIPSANAVYNLGSPTAQWASVYIGNATLYLGDTAVSANNVSNTLIINGNTVVTANATGQSSTTGNVAISGNVTGGNFITGGYVSATGNVTGNYIIGDGSLLTNLPVQTGTYSNTNVASYLTVLTSNVSTTANVYSGNISITGNVYSSNVYSSNVITTNTVINSNVSTTGNVYGGNLSASGNVNATYFIGDGSYLSGIVPVIQSYLFANVASNVSPYYQAVPISQFTIGNLTTATTTVGTTATLIGEFITNLGYPNTTSIPPGQITIRYETTKGSGAKLYTSYATLVKRSSAGTETLLLTSDFSSPTAVNTLVQQTVTALNTSTITLLTTDRLAVKIYAYTATATDSITLSWDDNTDSGFDLPTAPPSVSNFIPYQNATANVFLGVYDLSTAGNVYASNVITANTVVNNGISTTGNVTANYIIGNGSQLTNLTTIAEAPFSIQTGNFSAGQGNRYGVDTTSNTVTATLPLSPTTGGAVYFADAGGAYATNNLTVNPNGQTIMGVSGNMTVSTNGQSFGLFYNGTTWRTYSAI